MDLSKFKALSFDCYGTLIDWEKGITNVLKPWLDDQGLKLSENEILEMFAKIETRVQAEHPDWKYPNVLEEVAVRIGKELNLAAGEMKTRLANSVGQWPAFTDTTDALIKLGKQFKLVILSNISEDAFNDTNTQQLNIDFFKVLTAERIGSYKPNSRNFEFMFEELAKNGIDKSEILHVAQSLYHDMVPATSLGMKTVWINRRKNKPGSGATPLPDREVKVDLEFETLGEFSNHLNTLQA
ncbi:MAG: haloacid dehalogenase type II [Cyclobacteriaceae bacterium]